MAYAAAGLLGLALLYDILGESEADHDDVVEQTADELASATPDDATVYADHLPKRDFPNPESSNVGNDHIPDVVVTSGVAQNLVVEVETKSSLEDESEAAESQLEDFATPSYRRLLVVPDDAVDESVVSEFEEQLNEEVSGTVHVETPSTVASHL